MRLIPPLTVLLLAAGCAAVPYVREPTAAAVRIEVIWAERPAELCPPSPAGYVVGCAFLWPWGQCRIIAQRPANFADTRLTEILGHELLHCLGATHQ